MKVDFRKNAGLKILSVLMALFFWTLVAGEKEKVKDFALPLEFINLPSYLEISGPVVDTIVVRVRASEAILRTLSEDRMDARVDLKAAPSGRLSYTLTPAQFRIPSGSKIISIQPKIVELNLEPKLQKEIPVRENVQGSPAPGFEVEEIIITPPTLRIEGPATEVEETNEATTGLILLNGENKSLEVSVNPVPLAPQNSRVRAINAAKTLVLIRIRERPVRRSFLGVPVQFKGKRFRTQVDPNLLQITLEGPSSLIQGLEPSDLRIEISLEGLTPRVEDYRLEPRVVFPDLSADQIGELQVIGWSQKFVNVRVYPESAGGLP